MSLPLTMTDCPVCRAVLTFTHTQDHLDWHIATGTMHGWSLAGALYAIQQDAADPPTEKLPPIRETVLRRPPPPTVRELRGSELLSALAEEIAKLEHEDDDGHQL